MRIAIILLCAIAATHIGHDLIALRYEQSGAAAKAWFYMLRGLEGVTLFAIIASVLKRRVIVAVCAVGMFEEGMTTACRASKPIGGVLGYAPFSGLCGHEWYLISLGLLGLVALGIAYEIGRARHGKNRP